MSADGGGDPTRITLLCATQRGLRVLRRLIEIVPEAELTVMSFREEAGEPPFFDDIRELATAQSARFAEARQVGSEKHAWLWQQPPDLLLTVSWRYMVPPAVYQRAGRGAYVFHDSLLPAYRGFAPTVWAIVNGADHTGVTLFQMAEAVDAGPIVDQVRVPIEPDDAIGDVMERVTEGYLDLLGTNLGRLLAGTAVLQPQNDALATYTCRRGEADGLIDWRWPTRTIYNLIRAHTRPYWGAFTTLDGAPLRIWRARMPTVVPHYVGRVPGRVVEIQPGVGATVLTGDGALTITEVQLEGEPTNAATVVRSIGQTLGRASPLNRR